MMTKCYDDPDERETPIGAKALDALHERGLGEGPLAEAIAAVLPLGTTGEYFTIAEAGA